MSARIEDLEPVTRGMCEKLLAACPDIRVTWTLRSNDEQLHLYAQGRRLENGLWVVVDPGKIVTKAMPGKSPHNQVIGGLAAAFDICFRGSDPYLQQHEADHKAVHPRWGEVGALGEGFGLSWGGPHGPNDKFKWDKPHFERPEWKKVRV